MPVRAQRRGSAAEREPAERRLRGRSARRARLAARSSASVGIEHQQALRRDDGRDRELDVGEAVEVIDAVFAEVIRADVGDERDRRLRDGNAAAQDASSRRLESRPPRAARAVPGARRPGPE